MITLKSFIIGIVLIALFSSAFVNFIVESSEEYEKPLNENFSLALGRINSTMVNESKMSKDMETYARNISEGSWTGVAGGVVSGVSAVAGMVLMPFVIVKHLDMVIVDAITIIGLPSYVSTLYHTLIAIIIAMIVLSLVLRYKDV